MALWASDADATSPLRYPEPSWNVPRSPSQFSLLEGEPPRVETEAAAVALAVGDESSGEPDIGVAAADPVVLVEAAAEDGEPDNLVAEPPAAAPLNWKPPTSWAPRAPAMA